MAELAHGTQPEFWRPPSQRLGEEGMVQESQPTMAEACPRCGTEFLLGSHFCHNCGGKRPQGISAAARHDAAAMARLWEKGVHWMGSLVAGISWDWIRVPSGLRHWHFDEIKRWLGLSTASLIAFIVGLACVTGALLVGLLTAKTLVDWQAIQFYRAEWLLAATAAFVAAILLKKTSPRDRD